MRLYVILLALASVAYSAEIQGKVLSGVAAGSPAGTEVLIQVGPDRYIAKTSSSGLILSKRSTTAKDGKSASVSVEGMAVATSGGPIAGEAEIKPGTPVQIILGPVVSVWMFPALDADGKPMPGGWRSSVVTTDQLGK